MNEQLLKHRDAAKTASVIDPLVLKRWLSKAEPGGRKVCQGTGAKGQELVKSLEGDMGSHTQREQDGGRGWREGKKLGVEVDDSSKGDRA